MFESIINLTQYDVIFVKALNFIASFLLIFHNCGSENVITDYRPFFDANN